MHWTLKNGGGGCDHPIQSPFPSDSTGTKQDQPILRAFYPKPVSTFRNALCHRDLTAACVRRSQPVRRDASMTMSENR
jgi:hypothetical protein